MKFLLEPEKVLQKLHLPPNTHKRTSTNVPIHCQMLVNGEYRLAYKCLVEYYGHPVKNLLKEDY